MANIGIFFGTDTGKTRKVAKLIYEQFGSDADEPVNIGKASVNDLLAYDKLILGTPTLGEGELPGIQAQCESESWAEIIDELAGANLSGKVVALFGLGDQESYTDHFVDALGELYDAVADAGATIIGFWPNQGYQFRHSAALDQDHFVGLVLDQDNQSDLTADRIAQWSEQLKQQF